MPEQVRNITLKSEKEQTKDQVFEAVLKENYNRVLRLCTRYFGSIEEAEDATQDAFEKVWNNIGKFRGESSVSTWIYRIATNVCISRLRSLRNGPVRLDGVRAESSDEDYLEEKRAAEREEEKVRFLNDFLKGLNPADRSIVSLYLEDVESKTIAEITGMTDTNIRTRIHRIKNMIKTEWEKRYGA